MTSTSTARGSRVEKVRQGLLQDLVGGTLRVGTKLVNEESLAARFNVSRLTVREAVAALVTAGYLERLHGSGTYVIGLPGPRHALNVTLSYTHMISDAGMKPGLEVLSIASGPANDDESSELELETDEDVRRLERLRTADGRAVIYSIDTLPERYVSRVNDKRFSRSLYDLLTKIGHQVVSANAVLLPVTANKRLATLLDVKVGSALQRIHEVDYTKEGRPVLLSTEWHVPGVFELSVNRRP